MADLIDRDLTIYELEAFRESCIANLMRMSFDDVKDFVKGIPAVNRWIPYSEKRPDLWCEYLTYNAENGAMYVLSFSTADDTFGIYDGNVTHWMPLPEPPEKE